jgi:hypothetical protein
MANGVLSQKILLNTEIDIPVLVYQTPVGSTSSITLLVTNLNSVSSTASITLGLDGDGGLSDLTSPSKYILDFGVELLYKQQLERTGLVLGANQSLYLQSSAEDICINIIGYEETE